MATKKFGLGKGLGALIPEENIINDTNQEKINQILNININKIQANTEQPRRFFDDSKILELSESLKQHGIIQPLVLTKKDKKYIIVAGERRWRAAKLAGFKEVPAITMELSDENLLQVSLIENIQREDLNPIEEALAYEKLLKEYKLTQEELSFKIGKSRTSITNAVRLLKLDNRVKEYLIQGIISEGHGKVLLTLENGDLQYEVTQKIIDDNLSVRETEKIIKQILNNKNNNEEQETKKTLNPYYKDLKDKLQDYFGTKVSINSNKNKGKIEIEYYSEEDLQRILDIINL